MFLLGSLVDWTEWEKNLWILSGIYQQKLLNLKSKEEKDWKNQNIISKNCGTTTKSCKYTCNGNTRRRRKIERNRSSIWSNNVWEFLPNKCQTQNHRSRKLSKCQAVDKLSPKPAPSIEHTVNCRKSKIKKIILKKPEGKTPYL